MSTCPVVKTKMRRGSRNESLAHAQIDVVRLSLYFSWHEPGLRDEYERNADSDPLCTERVRVRHFKQDLGSGRRFRRGVAASACNRAYER
jgi:hypothetical protein